jgi:hypothetical protein
MAKKQKIKITSNKGTENSLSILGSLLLVAAIFIFILSFGFGGVSSGSKWDIENISSRVVVLAFGSLMFGIIWFVILRAIADIIRLLKNLNGLDFSGEISQPIVEIKYKCPECGNFVSKNKNECDSCGEKFE